MGFFFAAPAAEPVRGGPGGGVGAPLFGSEIVREAG